MRQWELEFDYFNKNKRHKSNWANRFVQNNPVASIVMALIVFGQLCNLLPICNPDVVLFYFSVFALVGVGSVMLFDALCIIKKLAFSKLKHKP